MIETEHLPTISTNLASTSANTVVNGFDSANAVNFVSYLPRPAYRFKPTLTLPAVNETTESGFGRRLRKNLAQVRRHIDSISSVLNYIEHRTWQRTHHPPDRISAQPHILYSTDCFPPAYTPDNPIDCVTSKFVRSAMNKVKCPIYDVVWTPEGRRLITGASSGEFTLWNGTAFNFETILQAHDSAVRAMEWSHSDLWLVTADHDGFVKYWQTNMNNVTMFQAHKESVRSLSFCPTDVKFATASDDGTVRVWDFMRCHEERILRGHGSDVRCVDWHPAKALLVSGSRDSQQPVKLWDPRSGQCLTTLHDHKNAVMAVQWNANGNWFVSASRDHLIKLYDIRMMKEMFTFKGHKKEVTALSWHPIHESLLVSGGADGAMLFWLVGNEKEVGLMETAHEQAIWTLKWHPLGHILASGSNDNNTKFWTRNKPGDLLEDFYGMVTTHPFDQSGGQMGQTVVGGAVGRHYQQPAQEMESPTKRDVHPSGHQPVPWAAASNRGIPPSDIPSSNTLPGIGNDEATSVPTDESGIANKTSFDIGGIPGLGGVDAGAVGEVGGGGPALPLTQPTNRRSLLKQPPPKRTQRQFERIWNVAGAGRHGSTGAPELEEAPALADSDFRNNRRAMTERQSDNFGTSGRPPSWARNRPPDADIKQPPLSFIIQRAVPKEQSVPAPPQPLVVDLSESAFDLGPGEWDAPPDKSPRPPLIYERQGSRRGISKEDHHWDYEESMRYRSGEQSIRNKDESLWEPKSKTGWRDEKPNLPLMPLPPPGMPPAFDMHAAAPPPPGRLPLMPPPFPPVPPTPPVPPPGAWSGGNGAGGIASPQHLPELPRPLIPQLSTAYHQQQHQQAGASRDPRTMKQQTSTAGGDSNATKASNFGFGSDMGGAPPPRMPPNMQQTGSTSFSAFASDPRVYRRQAPPSDDDEYGGASGGGDQSMTGSDDGSRQTANPNPKRKWTQDYEAEESAAGAGFDPNRMSRAPSSGGNPYQRHVPPSQRRRFI